MSHWGLDVLEMAARAGRLADLPLYVHTGELFPVNEANRPAPEAVMASALKLFKPGDVLAHVYSSMPDGIVGHGEGIPEFVRQANDRGIHFDIGYGINFSYAIARKMMAAGIFPRTISSDMHGDFTAYHDNSKLDYSLCGAMTRLWALGMPLKEIIRRVTVNPARILRDPEIGTLAPGTRADVTVLERVQGPWRLTDSCRAGIVAREQLVPRLVVLRGETIEPTRRYLPDLPARSGAGYAFSNAEEYVDAVKRAGAERASLSAKAAAYAKRFRWPKVVEAYLEEIERIRHTPRA